MIFDGRAFAKQIEEKVKAHVQQLEVKPHIVSVLVGDDPASHLYTRLKKEMAERVGIGFEISKLTNEQTNKLTAKIVEIGQRDDVTGLMVQMPIPGLSRVEQNEVLKVIPLAKDVDGLRWQESGVMPATVKAILSVLDKIASESKFKIQDSRFVVVGSHGSVGRPLVHFLRGKGVQDIVEINSDTPEPTRSLLVGDVIISCVGKAGVITGEMVSPGVIAVDVGISKVDGRIVGDMMPDVYQKASIAVPVPGGVGPVTVASLMENIVAIQ